MWAFVVDNKPAVVEDAYSSASTASMYVVYLMIYQCCSFKIISERRISSPIFSYQMEIFKCESFSKSLHTDLIRISVDVQHIDFCNNLISLPKVTFIYYFSFI